MYCINIFNVKVLLIELIKKLNYFKHSSFKNEDVLYRSNILKKHWQIFWNLTSNLLIIASICKVIFEYFNYIFTFILNWHFAQSRVLSFKKNSGIIMLSTYNLQWKHSLLKLLFSLSIVLINLTHSAICIQNIKTKIKVFSKPLFCYYYDIIITCCSMG